MATYDRKEPKKEPAAGAVRGEVVEEICRHIEPHLPLESLDQLREKLDAIKIGNAKIPIALIAPHIGKDAFPVRDAKDLKAKVSEGAGRAVSLSRSFRPKMKDFDRAVGELTQTEAKIGLRRPAVHSFYYPE